MKIFPHTKVSSVISLSKFSFLREKCSHLLIPLYYGLKNQSLIAKPPDKTSGKKLA